jgi:hypothetical protein
MSIRELARTFRHSRVKIRQVLAEPEPRPYVRGRLHCPKLGRFHGVIDQILADDEKAPRKQRHTAMQVFRRLVAEEGYRGGSLLNADYHTSLDPDTRQTSRGRLARLHLTPAGFTPTPLGGYGLRRL